MNEYESKREELIANFRDEDYRESYAEDFLNTSIATQIKVIREQRGITQAKLAEETGTKQTAISRIENVNNTARNIGTLLKIAFELGCRLKVSFETFGSMIDESLQFSRENLERPSFEHDPVFVQNQAAITGALFTASSCLNPPVNASGYAGSLVVSGVTIANDMYHNVAICGVSDLHATPSLMIYGLGSTGQYVPNTVKRTGTAQIYEISYPQKDEKPLPIAA